MGSQTEQKQTITLNVNDLFKLHELGQIEKDNFIIKLDSGVKK